MKYYLVLVIAFILSSCQDKTEKYGCLRQVEFMYTLRTAISLKNVGGVGDKTFMFYRNETLCSKDETKAKITSLDITIPDNVTSFSLNGKSECKCIYTYEKTYNNFIRDTIKTGIAQGVLVNKDLWEVVIKIKDFDFKGTISSNEKHNGFRVKVVVPDGADM